MERQLSRAARLAAIDALPGAMQDEALVDWQTVAAIIAKKDTRKLVIEAGVPLVQVSARRKLPRWGSLREWLKSREMAPEAA